jgi:hypothetical protein
VHSFSDVRQIAIIHAAVPLISDTSSLEVEITIAKLNNYKLSCSEQIPAEMIQAGGGTL